MKLRHLWYFFAKPTVSFETCLRKWHASPGWQNGGALLIPTGGAEAQHMFYMLPVIGDSYDGALKALKECFVPKLYVIRVEI